MEMLFLILVLPGWNVSMTLSHPWLVGYSLRIPLWNFVYVQSAGEYHA